MDRAIINEMTADELRFLAKRQVELISAYEKMVFMKDGVIESLEKAYNTRVGMEEARIEYDVKMSALRHTQEMIYQRIDGKAVMTCEAVKDGDGDG